MTNVSNETIAQKGKKALASAVVLAAMGAGMMIAASPAHATEFTVNTTNDANDHVCNAAHCSLREAMDWADVTSGPDAIKFNIPGGGVKTIKPTSGLPSLLDDGTTIDGYSQPGSVVNTSAVGTNAQPLIELDGSLAGSPGVDGLEILGDNVTVKGLVINHFSGSGIFIRENLGDPEHAGRNTTVQGNFIGTDPTGTLDLGNGVAGVQDGGQSGAIGGTTLAARNLLSGNGADGVLLESANTLVLGNLIGLKKDGLSALGNSRDGVRVNDGDANVGHLIARNSISFNGALGIDLDGDGPTANDAGDADQGANNQQNKPVIGRATTGGSGTAIKGTLNSTPNRTFTVEFYSNPAGQNEGQTFLGEKNVTTDASGKAAFSFKPQAKVPRGKFVTTTATSDGFIFSGDTSEFSAPEKVVRPR